jgi:hypothetical protein
MPTEEDHMSTFVENIETASDDVIVVWFNEAGQTALNTTAAEITFSHDHYTVQWTDSEGNDHEVQFDGSPNPALGLERARSNPGFTVIDHIQSYAEAELAA